MPPKRATALTMTATAPLMKVALTVIRIYRHLRSI
jgi:hypothetical protein